MNRADYMYDAAFVLSCCGAQQILEISKIVAELTDLTQGKAAERIYEVLRHAVADMLEE